MGKLETQHSLRGSVPSDITPFHQVCMLTGSTTYPPIPAHAAPCWPWAESHSTLEERRGLRRWPCFPDFTAHRLN